MQQIFRHRLPFHHNLFNRQTCGGDTDHDAHDKQAGIQLGHGDTYHANTSVTKASAVAVQPTQMHQ